jgi:hypothetical protein
MAGLGGPRAGLGVSMAEQRFPRCKDLMIMEPVSKVSFFTKWGHEVEKTMVGVLTDFPPKCF